MEPNKNQRINTDYEDEFEFDWGNERDGREGDKGALEIGQKILKWIAHRGLQHLNQMFLYCVSLFRRNPSRIQLVPPIELVLGI
jgi:hypothetical protein